MKWLQQTITAPPSSAVLYPACPKGAPCCGSSDSLGVFPCTKVFWFSTLGLPQPSLQLSLNHSSDVTTLLFLCKKSLLNIMDILLSENCCSVAQMCPTLCDPMNCSTPGLPVIHYLPEFTQIHVHPVISFSVVPFSFWPQPFPASGSFPIWG